MNQLDMHSDKSVAELRRELGIEPEEGGFSEGDVSYGPMWPKNPFDWRYRCSMQLIEVDE